MLKKRLLTIGILAVVCIAAQLFLKPAFGSAEQPAPVEQPPLELSTPVVPAGSPDPCQLQTSLMQKLLWMLLLIALMAFAIWWACKKMSCKWTGSGGKLINRLETLSIGPRNALHLVQVGNKKFLISAGPDQVAMLADVSDALAAQKPE